MQWLVLLALLPGLAAAPLKKWQVLGPFVVGKNELDGEPWKAQTNGSRANGANVSELGDVQVTSRRAEANGLVAVQWEVDWQSLVSFVGGHELLEWQALAWSSFKAEGLVQLRCQGVAAFTVDDNITLVGDLYFAQLPPHPVHLSPGSHRLSIRLRGKLKTQFSCHLEKVKETSSKILLFGESFLAVPDLLVLESEPSVVHVCGERLALGVANQDLKEWITELRPILLSPGRLSLAAEQPATSPLAPGQMARIPVNFEANAGATCNADEEVMLELAFEGKIAGRVLRSGGLKLRLKCRHAKQSFVFTFQDVDGSTQHAAAVMPQSCKGDCPVLVTLSGTSISARDSSSIPRCSLELTKVTDVFLDFDGTLTTSNHAGVSGYCLPLLERCGHLRVSDALDGSGVSTWSDLDLRMAAATGEVALDYSDSSVLGSWEVRRQLQGSLETLVLQGLRIHVLTMGTPQTCKALLAAGGYDVNLFSHFLGPADMARNQGLRHLFDHSSDVGSAESFEFDVQEDIDALHHLEKTGEGSPILERIMSMETQLYKASLILSLAGQGADAYKMKHKKDKDYRFGFKDAWLLAPTRHGAHNWEGPGLLTAIHSLDALRSFASRGEHGLPSVDVGRVLVAGHSMGGHGAWLFACHMDVLGVISSASWLRKDQYSDSNKVFLHDVATAFVEPTLAALLRQAELDFDVEAQAASLVHLPVLIRVGSRDRTSHPWFSRRIYRTLRSLGAQDVTLSEIPDKEHWWWDTDEPNDGGAVNDPEIRHFVARVLTEQAAETPRSWRLLGMASKGGLSLWPQRADRQAEVFVELPEGSAAVLRTSNVRRLQWRPSPQRQGVKQALVDGELLVVPEDEVASWCLQDDRWQLCGKLPLTERHARQAGPLRRIISQRLCGLADEEGQEALRFFGNMLLMTGHGGIRQLSMQEAVDDGVLVPPEECEALLVLGTPMSNPAAAALLKGQHGTPGPTRRRGGETPVGDAASDALHWAETPIDPPFRHLQKLDGIQEVSSNGKSRAHTFLVVSSLTTVFLFSGTVFGWGALSSMLQRDARRNGRLQEGYYDWLCDAPDPNHPCEQQLQALNNAFTLATTFVSLTAFANGWLVDTFGPMKVTILAGAMSCVGLMGIALTRAIPGTKSEAKGGFDVFLWSLLLVAVGGSMTMFIGYQAPFVIPSHFTLLIEVNSCLFDAGTIIFPILKLLYDAGVPFAAFFWTYTELNDIRAAASGDTDLAGSSAAAPERQRPLEQRGMLSQMASWEFAAIFIYSIIQVPRANMYMGSVELVNRKMAEAEGFIIPFGFLAVPLIELCVHRLGTIPTVQVTTLLGVVYNLMQLIPKLYLQLATVCVFAAWRAFLYSTISAFNGETFGVKTMGRIMGLCFVFSGLTNMITGPLVNAAVDSQNFTALLVEALCVCIPLPIIFQLLQWKRSRESHPATQIDESMHSCVSLKPVTRVMNGSSCFQRVPNGQPYTYRSPLNTHWKC
ncbi:unnamed protein product [Durusdinium trenchii]|uniref:Uncharacterized protein n=1 Tax=Durusdinium trenchii TaxID=1381693 RepID=A0ABP0IPV0_9DINO